MFDAASHATPGTGRLNLLIADHFSGYADPLVQIDVLTERNTEVPPDIWAIHLKDGEPETFIHDEVGYWVRHAVLSTDEQRCIPCRVGFSPETGQFIKLLAYEPAAPLTVWLTSGPLTHLLYLEHIE